MNTKKFNIVEYGISDESILAPKDLAELTGGCLIDGCGLKACGLQINVTGDDDGESNIDNNPVF